MTSQEEIQSAVKSGNAILGYKETVKFVKSGGSIKQVIVANNTPEEMGAEIKRSVEAANMKLEVFDGTSKDLGTTCGKPFPVAALVIKG